MASVRSEIAFTIDPDAHTVADGIGDGIKRIAVAFPGAIVESVRTQTRNSEDLSALIVFVEFSHSKEL